MSESTPAPTAQHLAAAVAALVEPVFSSLAALAEEVLTCRGGRSGPCSEKSLSGLEQAIAPRLAAHPSLAGMGYVAAPGAVLGHDRYLVWWQRAGEELARLRLNFDASSVDVYDYLQMDWFQEARAGGVRNAFGPYVDYSGSGLYVVTASVPILADDVFVGVAGADIMMAALERHLIAILRTRPTEAVVVNDERHVLAANTPTWVVGSRLPAPPQVGEQGFTAVETVPGGPGWLVATTERSIPG